MRQATIAGVVVALACLTTVAVHAQHPHKGSGAGAGNGMHQPYAGHQTRRAAALSDEEVAGILEGRGMGYALPAEVNGYPGPMHVLELANELGLSAEQRAAVQQRFDQMKERAREAGRRYIAAEEALDTTFKSKAMDVAAIKSLTLEADKMRAEFRFAHLQAHIEMRALLTREQLERYAQLRGYSAR